ncbi:uncharacterized protein PHALS_09670 [Plasmopara halstedii]|uniref:Uncharacterized protein n=1 Tax=Plasmopara halstedii TaxID=4781 RepID=A0A0P1AG39_PLAHL|nr:uncharacterized protein PHALS_09670 [Plasmopara halstedii]CEG39423.1 hypothetical protein PHALS_09670 [Plasmopara halstedii]|eukprot:XP_024575792.1 hypothetical protein PHALS_09670 [Plasmopara halstedii]
MFGEATKEPLIEIDRCDCVEIIACHNGDFEHQRGSCIRNDNADLMYNVLCEKKNHSCRLISRKYGSAMIE